MKKFLKLIVNLFFTIYWYVLCVLIIFGGVFLGTIVMLLKQRKIIIKAMPIWSAVLLFGGLKPLKITGIENYDPGKSYLIIMNHSSFFDIPAAMYSFGAVKWMFKKELLKTPVLGVGLKDMGFIPIDRKDFRHSLQAVNEAVKNTGSLSLGMFPEGTRTPDGKIHEFKRGFVKVIKNSDLNVLPVTLNGFFQFKPKNKITYNFFSKLEVIVHSPIPNAEFRDMEDAAIIEKVRSIIESAHKA